MSVYFLEKRSIERLTGAVSEEQNRVGDDLLCVACSVGGRHAQDHDECGVVGSGEVVADESARRVLGIEIGETKCAGDIGEQEDQDEEATRLATVSRHVVVCENTDQDADGDEDAVGDLQQCCSDGREPEALNDKCALVRQLDALEI